MTRPRPSRPREWSLTTLAALGSWCLVLSGCSLLDTSGGPGLDQNGSSRPISDEAPETVYEDWHGAIIGTMDATGKSGYTTEAGGPFPDAHETFEDWLPGFRCSASIHRELDAAFLRLAVETFGPGQGYTDYDEPLAKVASYWESQGWEPETSGGAGGNMKAIQTTTTHGTLLVYTAGAGGDSIEAQAPCLYTFNEDYNPDYSPPPQ